MASALPSSLCKLRRDMCAGLLWVDGHLLDEKIMQIDGAEMAQANRNRGRFRLPSPSLPAATEIIVIRYDTAHGQAHQDILGKRSGLIEKAWLLDLTNNEAFEYAIQGFKHQYEYYIQFYLAN